MCQSDHGPNCTFFTKSKEWITMLTKNCTKLLCRSFWCHRDYQSLLKFPVLTPIFIKSRLYRVYLFLLRYIIFLRMPELIVCVCPTRPPVIACFIHFKKYRHIVTRTIAFFYSQNWCIILLYCSLNVCTKLLVI